MAYVAHEYLIWGIIVSIGRLSIDQVSGTGFIYVHQIALVRGKQD